MDAVRRARRGAGRDGAAGARERRAPDRRQRRHAAGGRDGDAVLGIIHLKDVVKGGIKERFDRFRAMGIRTVMITGDNPRTAAAIAKEAGVDDFLAEATPEAKMRLIKDEQAKGKLVAMTGDGTNDAPALAQADVGVAMNTGTQAAKEAGNMVDLDSNPTKLLEVVEVGKQLLMTRGTLTTFSIANDVAKYFAILPALFMGVFPEIAPLNVMRLASPLLRDPLGRHLQRAHHHRPDPAGAARRALPAAGRRGAAAGARCSSTAWAGHRPRSSASSSSTWLLAARRSGLRTRHAQGTRRRAARHRSSPWSSPGSSTRSRSPGWPRCSSRAAANGSLVTDEQGRVGGLRADRPGLRRAPATSSPGPRRRGTATTATASVAAPTSARPRRSCASATAEDAGPSSRRRTPRRPAGAGGAGDRLRQRARPAPVAGGRAVAGAADRQGARHVAPSARPGAGRCVDRGPGPGFLGRAAGERAPLNLALDRQFGRPRAPPAPVGATPRTA